MGEKLAEAASLVREQYPDAFILHHAPLLSDLFQSNREIKFRRTLSLPLKNSYVPWLAPEDLVKAIHIWLLNKQDVVLPKLLTGANQLTGEDLAIAVSEALHRNLDSRRYALRCFQELDRDRNGQIDANELYPYLCNLGYDSVTAHNILQQADTNHDGSIDFEEFIQGLGKHLEKILADVPDRVQYVSVPPSTTLHDLIASGMPQHQARSWLDWLESIQKSGLAVNQEIASWLGRPQILAQNWLERHILNFINVYILPARGILTLNEGIFEDRLAIYTRILQSDDRFLIGMHTLDGQAMDWEWFQEDINDHYAEVITYKGELGEWRTLKLKDNQIVSLSVRGAWRERHLATELFFEHAVLPRWQINLFRELGELQLETKSTLMESSQNICNCTQTTYSELQKLITNGLDNLENLAHITHITMICGGCQPLVEEMLGSAKLAIAELVSKQDLGRGVFHLNLRPVDAKVTASQPGQYILIQARIDGIWKLKPYILSSPANQTETYQITVNRDELDSFSSWLSDRADRNSVIRISQPLGISYLPVDSQIYFFAADMGVIPAIAMMRTLANYKDIPEEDIQQFHLDWSVSYPEDLVFRTELEWLTTTHDNFSITLRPTQIEGKITEPIIGYQYPPNEKIIALLCGSQSYMDAVQEYLQATGWSESNIKQLAMNN